jgi:hypothetical protein
MYSELSNPQVSIVDRFDPDVISGMSYVGLAIADIILIQMVVRASLNLLAPQICQYDPQVETTRQQGERPLQLELAKTRYPRLPIQNQKQCWTCHIINYNTYL